MLFWDLKYRNDYLHTKFHSHQNHNSYHLFAQHNFLKAGHPSRRYTFHYYPDANHLLTLLDFLSTYIHQLCFHSHLTLLLFLLPTEHLLTEILPVSLIPKLPLLLFLLVALKFHFLLQVMFLQSDPAFPLFQLGILPLLLSAVVLSPAQ